MSLAEAKVELDVTSGALATLGDAICVIAPVRANADGKARQFGSFNAIMAQHDYCEGAEFAALFIEETRRPVLFQGIPIATQGTIGQENTTGNTGSSVTSLTLGTGGTYGEHDGVVRVLKGGTISTDLIQLEVSLDGGKSFKTVSLGTNSTYAIPYANVTINFAAGTLVTGDTLHTWHGTAPKGDAAGIQLARQELAKQPQLTKEWLLIGDLDTDTECQGLVSEVNAYRSSSDRSVLARAAIRDRLPFSRMAKVTGRMSQATLTFAEVGVTGDTITRIAGSFLLDGMLPNDWITITGTASNNVQGLVPTVTATVLTLGTLDLAAEATVTTAVITWQGSLTFTTGTNTILRNRGSWFDDNFRVGQRVTVVGVAGVTVTNVLITALTATLMTLASGIGSTNTVALTSATITAGELEPAYVAAMETEFAPIIDEELVSLSLGRGFKQSPVTKYFMRRPAAWAAAIRSHQFGIQVPTWQKKRGSLSGWSLQDSNNVTVEYDDRANLAAASNARFTSLRTYSSSGAAVYLSQDKTRATPGSLVAHSHNMNVVNLCVNACQAATEQLIGEVVELKEDKPNITEDGLATLETNVNSEVTAVSMKKNNDGYPTSGTKWVAARDDDFSVEEPTLHGALEINLNGTIHRVLTRARASR